jgi:hypothetical protein
MNPLGQGDRTFGLRVLAGGGNLAVRVSLDFEQKLFRRNYRRPVLVAAAVAAEPEEAARWIAAGAARVFGHDLAARVLNRVAAEGAEPLFLQAMTTGAAGSAGEEICRGLADVCFDADCAFLEQQASDLRLQSSGAATTEEETTSPSPYPPPSRGRGEEETATASPSNAGGFKSEERWIVPLAADLYRAILEAGFRPERRTAGLRISTRHWNAAGLRLADGEGRGGRRTAQRLRRRLAHAWSHLAMQQRFVLTLSETQNLSPAELARVLGQNETAAQKLRDEAKLALLALLARPERRSWLRRRREEDES